MPSLESMSLFNASGPCAGGFFTLVRKPRKTGTVVLDGWTTEIRDDSTRVVSRGGTAVSYDDAFRSSLTAAQRALDLVSIKGVDDLELRDVSDSHGAWWQEGPESVLRVASTIQIPTPEVNIAFEVRDAAGNLVPTPPPPPPRWDESFRYYRLSQTSDDLFEAYRNLYLGFESILSAIHPYMGAREGEWLRAGLAVADGLIGLASHVPKGTLKPIDFLYRDLYIDRRNTVFHAKRGRVSALPHDESERTAVVASFTRLLDLYLRLAELHTQMKRPRSGWYAAFIRAQLRASIDGCTVHATDDDGPIDPNSKVPNPNGGSLIPLDTQVLPEGEHDRQITLRGTASVAPALKNVPVRRLIAVDADREPMFAEVFDAPLRMNGLTRFEIDFAVRSLNRQEPRKEFAT